MQQSETSIELSMSVSPQKKAGVIAQQVLEEMVLYDSNTEMGYSLNGSARKIWDLCDGKRSLTVICSEIAKELQIDAELLRDDVKTTIYELASLGLLLISEDSQTVTLNASE